MTSRSFDEKGWHLVFLDCYDGSSGGSLNGETQAWFEADLAATSLPTVVFSHQPLDGQPLTGNPVFEVDFAAHAHPTGHERARQIMAASGRVRMAVNGHTHWNHYVTMACVAHVTVQSLVDRAATGRETGSYAVLDLDERLHAIRVPDGSPSSAWASA